MRQAGSYELFAYWNELRGSRAAPERADIDPAAIRNLLADTFIVEVDQSLGHPICLAGTRLSALFEGEVKDRPFLSLWNEAQRPDVASLIKTVTDGVCPAVAGAQGAPPDYEKTEFELLLLPLRHLGKTHSRLLGRIAPSKHPSWLGLIPIPALDFMSMRVLETEDKKATSLASKTKRIDIAGGDGLTFSTFKQRKHLRIYIGSGESSQA